jgi:hypothetical protein
VNSEIHTMPRPTDTAPARPRRVKVLALGLVAAVGLGACSHDPSAFRVAQDIVNTLAVNDSQRNCMLDKLDAYGRDEVEAIAASAADAGPGTPLEQFEADLASCR